MRKYAEKDSRQLAEVSCNCCGRKLKLKKDVIEEGCVRAEIAFGFFSHKDGQRHHFDLCEDCYDRITESFQIPVTIEEMVELL